MNTLIATGDNVNGTSVVVLELQPAIDKMKQWGNTREPMTTSEQLADWKTNVFPTLSSKEKNAYISAQNKIRMAEHKAAYSNPFRPILIGNHPNGDKMVMVGNHYETWTAEQYSK